MVATGSKESCFGCHEMRNKLKGFESKNDRGHNGVCGTCHNPHKQTAPKQAFESCATNGCHSDLKKKSTFHAGLKGHASANCGQCHRAHEWKPVGRECIDCHRNIFRRTSGRARHPSRAQQSHRARLARTVPVFAKIQLAANRQRAATPQPPIPSAPKETRAFSHGIHKLLTCAGCHDQKISPGAVKVRTKSECAACHHSAERSVSCEGCHDARTKLSRTIMRAVSMRTNADAPAKQRSLPFAHGQHRDLECKGCHTSGVLLGVTRDCASCHTNHHTAERTCTTCHQPAKSVHQRVAHDGCAGSGCHSNSTVLALPPSRSACLTCHADQGSHKPKRECAECHAVSWGVSATTPR